MLRKISLATTSLFIFLGLNAQDSTKSLTFSGSVDGYYRTTFNNQQNNNTSFTNSNNSFEMGMASVRADATGLKGKVGATVDLGYGVRADENSYNDGPTSQGKNGYLTLALIKQAFITLQASPKVKFTFGKFGTHLGYEVLDAYSNRNYSMSYMFTNGPFFNTGVKSDFDLGHGFAMMLGVSNYTDETTSSYYSSNNAQVAFTTKAILVQLSGASKNQKFKFFINYTGSGGAVKGVNNVLPNVKSINQFDLVINSSISSKFGIGYNFSDQTRGYNNTTLNTNGSWVGNALYFNWDPTDKTGVTLRTELISDSKMTYYNSKSIFEATLSINKKIGPLIIIPEIRLESASSAIYIGDAGSTSKSAFSALLAAVYHF